MYMSSISKGIILLIFIIWGKSHTFYFFYLFICLLSLSAWNEKKSQDSTIFNIGNQKIWNYVRQLNGHNASA